MAVDPNELYDQLMRQTSAEHDIKAIAKQISDHAEAIYQTWKSKGLTPNQLLHLHHVTSDVSPSSCSSSSSSGASPSADVTPTAASHAAGSASGHAPPRLKERPKSSSSLSPVDLLASPQLEATLEELVNSFVQEDKARLLAARSRTVSPAPSAAAAVVTTGATCCPVNTIQSTKKRFENAATCSNGNHVVLRSAPTFQDAVAGDAAAASETVKSRAQRLPFLLIPYILVNKIELSQCIY